MSELPLVAVDIGNSSTKLGWSFSSPADGKLAVPGHTKSFSTGECPPIDLGELLPAGPLNWRIASVHREGSRLLAAWIKEHRPDDAVRFLSYRDLPIAVRTEAPQRVGLDRLAAAVAANVLRRNDLPAIVIDAGSAITVDLLAADGAFEGGAILPGFRMGAEALYGADLLPLALLAPDEEPPAVVGKDTGAAIRSGLFWGAVGGVRELVERMSSTVAVRPQIFVTGGDLRELAQHLGPEARFVPNLVLSGVAVSGPLHAE